MNRNQQALASAPYYKLALKLCVPSIVIMLVMIVYNMADTFFIGQTGDSNQIAAISLCGPLFSLLSGLGTLFGNGGCTSISLALGERDGSKTKAVSIFCLFGSLVVGGLFMAVVLLFLEPICFALGADADTVGDACRYLRIIALGAPFILFNTVFASAIRADGAAVSSMICNTLGTVANILLDALFILVFSWGVQGAALATVLGNLISCVYLVFYIYKKQPAFSFHPKSWKPEVILPVLSLGLPMACGTLLMSVSHILSNRLMMGYSATALTAQNISGKLGMLITMLIMGICMGLQPAISYNYGGRSFDRMYLILRKTMILTTCVGAALAVICFLGREAIITAFLDDAAVIEYGRVMVFASLATAPFYGIYQLCQTYLQSTGKASYAIFLSLLDKGIFFIPCLYLMSHFLGLYGVVFTPTVTTFLSLSASVFLGLRWDRAVRQQMELAQEPGKIFDDRSAIQ